MFDLLLTGMFSKPEVQQHSTVDKRGCKVANHTIAARHAAGSASTMPKNSASSSPAQAESERQAAKSKAAAQTASSSPLSQSDMQVCVSRLRPKLL